MQPFIELLQRLDAAVNSFARLGGLEGKSGSETCVICFDAGSHNGTGAVTCPVLYAMVGESKAQAQYGCRGCGLHGHGASDCAVKRIPQNMAQSGVENKLCGRCWLQSYDAQHTQSCRKQIADNTRALMLAVLRNPHFKASFKETMKMCNNTFGTVWTSADLQRLTDANPPFQVNSLRDAMLWLCADVQGVLRPRSQFLCLWWQRYCGRGTNLSPLSLVDALVC